MGQVPHECARTTAAVRRARLALQRVEIFRAHAFEFACAKADIDHRLTKPKHPWTNGQVERMNRTIKEATVKRFYYETHQHFRQHLTDFVSAYHFARRLKTLKGLPSYEYICSLSTKECQQFKFKSNPSISGTKQEWSLRLCFRLLGRGGPQGSCSVGWLAKYA